MMLTLGEKQRLFMLLMGQFLVWIYANGYEVTCGEFLRTPEQAARNAANGSGIVHSNHIVKLAADLNLFVNGIYQTDTMAYSPLGRYWKSLNPLCCWGGDFSKPDGNHFSLENNGIR